MRTAAEWEQFCAENLTAGYVPAGDKAGFYQRCLKSVEVLRELNLWHPGYAIVDIGCGNGRIALGLTEEDVTYYGIDVEAGALRFCWKAFAGLSHLRFIWLDVRNEHYNPEGVIEPAKVTIPLPDRIADLVIASSLFTHLGPEGVAWHYVQEAKRLLKPGGTFYSSWFLSPPNEITNDEKRTVYPADYVHELLAGGFSIQRERRGETTRPNDQRLILAIRGATS